MFSVQNWIPSTVTALRAYQKRSTADSQVRYKTPSWTRQSRQVTATTSLTSVSKVTGLAGERIQWRHRARRKVSGVRLLSKRSADVSSRYRWIMLCAWKTDMNSPVWTHLSSNNRCESIEFNGLRLVSIANLMSATISIRQFSPVSGTIYTRNSQCYKLISSLLSKSSLETRHFFISCVNDFHWHFFFLYIKINEIDLSPEIYTVLCNYSS